MPAQNGASVLLSYGPQGSQQAGSSVLLEYAVEVPSSTVRSTVRGRWGKGVNYRPEVTGAFGVSINNDQVRESGWINGIKLEQEDSSGWSVSAPVDDFANSLWGRYERRLAHEPASHWGASSSVDEQSNSRWGQYEVYRSHEPQAPWFSSKKADGETQVPWGFYGVIVAHSNQSAFVASAPRDVVRYAPWLMFSRVLNPDWGSPSPPGVPGPIPGETTIVPIRSVYMVLNETSLRRVSDNYVYPTISMSMQIDVDSWTWGFSAQLPGGELDEVQPTEAGPIEVEAALNGYLYRFIIEQVARERVFAQSTLRISGRGKSALIDAPYAPIRTFTNTEARTAQQLMEDALTVSGVSIGWDVDFGLTDWLVPANVWNHQGTHISAVKAIAEAAGGYVQPHPTDNELRILHRYPLAPWDWGDVTPDFELPVDLTTRESIEWVQKPSYNRVFVSGTSSGKLCQVTRTGTDGAIVAPMVTDPLIVHVDAGRQRGRAILSDTGKQAPTTLRLPVLEETGVIEPGKFVKYVDGGIERIGIVRSTSIENRHPQLFQTIGVETHVS